MEIAFEIGHEADIGAVRRRFATLAAAAGLDESRAGDAALIATELATNVIRHVGHGGALLGTLTQGDRRGVAIAVWDRGGGMNLDRCLRDGMSTAGTAGEGLGAVTRLATSWGAYAPHGKGTVIVASVFPRGRLAAPRFEVGAVCLPYPGLDVCGDGWAVHEQAERVTLFVCDGLGHGDGAADATKVALAAFRQRPDDSLSEILDAVDRAARGTRGACGTVVRIDLAAREATIAGVGNVAAWIAGAGQRQLVTQHGTLGQAMPKLREERYPFPAGSVLLVCSDGLKSRIDLADHAGLLGCDARTIATVLWRDHARGRDDATVVVLREARP